VPARGFVALCRRVCPHAVLSLGWSVGPLGPEQVYTQGDIAEMLRVCQDHHLPGSSVVFSASVRFAERNVPLLCQLLEQLPESQLLYWTGTGEMPIPQALQASIHMLMAERGLGERVGYDVQLAHSNVEHAASALIDCTFVFSRWSRWACGCCVRSVREEQFSKPLPRQVSDQLLLQRAGERRPLVSDMSPEPSRQHSHSLAPAPQRMPGSLPGMLSAQYAPAKCPPNGSPVQYVPVSS